MYATPPNSSVNSKTKIVGSNDPTLRLYQVWKGSNKFIFGGRFIFGPDVKSLFFTLFLILAPLILFWMFVANDLVKAISHGPGLFLIVISVILTTNIIVLLFLTSGKDPGIVPRNSCPPEPDDEGDTSSLSTDWTGSQSGGPSTIPLTKNVKVNGIIVKVKYCQTCMLYRPPRCSHCSICDNCVERFDHHCPWVGQCIGKRNYKYFFMFVSSTTVLCLYIFTCCWINIKWIMENGNCDLMEAFEVSPVSGILILYTFVVSWFVGGLTSFHVYLIATNQTTYENFRYRYDQKMSPYNLGCARNFKEILFSSVPNSRINLREKVKGELSASGIGSVSPYLGRNMSLEMPERSFDIETGKRQPVEGNEFEDIRNRVGSFERCRTQPRQHINDWDNKHIMLSSEFETELDERRSDL
ncbi:hypothetical protein RD792_008693 [Penstemon davidsonii]|uniref:S-acyltransferase n=1 Tax=Penstemon davidsonii TaxID=160366 RepID=A0ABR0D9U1_9LAMI|nr:hypothetical protein RD792_008693 [Penstemon davidsonii]